MACSHQTHIGEYVSRFQLMFSSAEPTVARQLSEIELIDDLTGVGLWFNILCGNRIVF